MKVSSQQPFQIVYSLYQHEFLGYLVEPFIVHVDEHGRLTYQHQNISLKNVKEFSSGLDKTDLLLIECMDKMSMNALMKKFSTNQTIKPDAFFAKVYHETKGEKALREYMDGYLENLRATIFSNISKKMLFEMGNDGEPTWRRLEVAHHPADIKFYFFRNDEQTIYYPFITYEGAKLKLPSPQAYLVCKEPAWLVHNSKLYGFTQEVDGKKIVPFLKKEQIVISKKLEADYFSHVVKPLVRAHENIEAEGFSILTVDSAPRAILTVSELAQHKPAGTLFEPERDTEGNEIEAMDDTTRMTFSLSFHYDKHKLEGDASIVSVVLEQVGDRITFYRIKRKNEDEQNYVQQLRKWGLSLNNFRTSLYKSQAFSWLNENRTNLLNSGFEVNQPTTKDKKYFFGKATIQLEVKENIDWFDIHAVIRFGEFSIPFKDIRKLILRKKVEFQLPNGEYAIIPEVWMTKYADLFTMSDADSSKMPTLKKHHLHVIKALEENSLAKVTISQRLRNLENFTNIKTYPLPEKFIGTLRPYQQAGYEWMMFLNEFNLGGCLADDMGLGKTVQTLALLQEEKNKGNTPSLLVMPTSLLYNWHLEAKKFTPDLRVLLYTGNNRQKLFSQFTEYDLILTSYGVARLDIEQLEKFAFHYIILDESQVIKNPTANTTRAVMRLRSKYRLTLTGTPIENTTLDLWSQMTFLNPGLLGTHAYFKKEYLTKIEKNGDEHTAKKLNRIIKPFMLRRMKSQVADDLPEKTESVQYTEMTPEQEARYEEAKSYYRNLMFEKMETEGIAKARFTILEGLTKLRQISNHPHLIDPAYHGDSGKMNDVLYMMENALSEGHKILIFSQFVKHLRLFHDELKKRDISFAYLDGASVDRKAQVDKFNDNADVRVFLISIKAGGVGLNLTSADYVFILDPWWNPAVEAQAIDRAYRIGQTKHVFTYKFITRNTVEEKILLLQKRKLSLSDNLIEADETMIKNLTKEDVEMLMS